jgi:hypothetical protein
MLLEKPNFGRDTEKFFAPEQDLIAVNFCERGAIVLRRINPGAASLIINT